MGAIRKATVHDVDLLIGMSTPFFAFSGYSKYFSIDKDQVAQGLCAVIDSGVIFIAETNAGEAIGAIAGVISNLWFAPSVKVASELGWWVNQKHRGSLLSIKLLHEFERWAKNNGATRVAMSDLIVHDEMPAGKLFEKLGYAVVERAHIKGV